MKRILLVLALLALTGCLEKNKTTTYHSSNYVYPKTTEVQCPWGWMNMPTGGFDWTGPCGQQFTCNVVCKPVPCDSTVPLPGSVLLVAVGTGAVGWVRKRRMI